MYAFFPLLFGYDCLYTESVNVVDAFSSYSATKMTLTQPNPEEHPPGAPPESGPNEMQDRVDRLEAQLALTTRQLSAYQHELDSLLYYLSHDLRAPLRGIDGYSRALQEEYGTQLDAMGQAYLNYIRDSSRQLSLAIEGLLKLSKIERQELKISAVDLSEIANELANDYLSRHPDREIHFSISAGIGADADASLAGLLLKCLFENALKFTSTHPRAQIEFDACDQGQETIFWVRDDGVGFNPAYSSQLFIPFQRLHSQKEFEGPGLGLAIAKRIIQRHGSRIWAEAKIEEGATFFFTLK